MAVLLVTIVWLITTQYNHAFVSALIPTSRSSFVKRNVVGFRTRRGPSADALLLFAAPEPLASEKDWTAYLDEKTTGMVYYFNSETGESRWERPTDTFPKVKLSSKLKRIARDKRKEYEAAKLETNAESPEEEEEVTEQGFFFGSIFGGGEGVSPSTGQMDEEVPAEDVLEEKKEEEEVSSSETSTEDDDTTTKAEKDLKDGKGDSDFFSNIFDAFQTDVDDTLSNTTAEKPSPFSLLNLFSSNDNNEDGAPKDGIITSTTVDEPDDVKLVQQQQKKKKRKGPIPQIITPSDEPIQIELASRVLPSPEKLSWGGEDALFVSGRTFGIFDGVSGAEKLDGVPLYSRTLASKLQKSVGKEGLNMKEITTELLTAAEYADDQATGASTALVASLGEDGYLRVCNVGDCVLVVFRAGEIVARTKEIAHYFDCPYQLSADSYDRPKDGTQLVTEVERGDLILCGSDGVFDNLTDEKFCDIVKSIPSEKPALIVSKIVSESRKVSLDEEAVTPYAKAAKRMKYEDFKSGLGGKVDDISCVVAKCK